MNWDPHQWKTSGKVWLGIATIWPVVYIALFMITVFSIIAFLGFEQKPRSTCGRLDLLQLNRKITNGEIKELRVRQEEFVVFERVGSCEFHTPVFEESSREEILIQARQLDANGKPFVEKIEEERSGPVSSALPIGFAVLFAAHIATIMLTLGLMPLYIILAVKNESFDQTMRIVWIIMLCMLGLMVMPVYWYLYIWRKPSPPATSIGAPA